MVAWANGPVELLTHDPTQGVERFAKGEGHKPWTPEPTGLRGKALHGHDPALLLPEPLHWPADQ